MDGEGVVDGEGVDECYMLPPNGSALTRCFFMGNELIHVCLYDILLSNRRGFRPPGHQGKFLHIYSNRDSTRGSISTELLHSLLLVKYARTRKPIGETIMH